MTVYRGLTAPDSEHSLVRFSDSPSMYEREGIEFDTGPAGPGPRGWITAPGRPTELRIIHRPRTRLVGFQLKDGTLIPGVDLPAWIGAEDAREVQNERALDNYGVLYDRIETRETPEPTVHEVDLSEVAWTLDDPDVDLSLGWDPSPESWLRGAHNATGFAAWGPGSIPNVRDLVGDRLKARLPGVRIDMGRYGASGPEARVTLRTGEVVKKHKTGVSGRKLKATYDAYVTYDVRLALDVPHAIAGSDFRDACRKLRALVDDLVEDITTVGLEACPHCHGKGFQPTKGKGQA